MPFADLARDREGHIAVEFAMLLPLYLTTLLMMLEVAMMFGSNVLLESAANNAARAVRTGQIFLTTANAATRESMFRDAMCSELFLIECNELSYNVQSFEDFGTADATVNCNGSGGIESPVFDIGDPVEIIVVTVIYPYQPFVPNPLTSGVVGRSAADGGCNGVPIRAVRVFQNEPFPNTPGAGV